MLNFSIITQELNRNFQFKRTRKKKNCLKTMNFYKEGNKSSPLLTLPQTRDTISIVCLLTAIAHDQLVELIAMNYKDGIQHVVRQLHSTTAMRNLHNKKRRKEKLIPIVAKLKARYISTPAVESYSTLDFEKYLLCSQNCIGFENEF